MNEAAYSGLAGAVVEFLEPHTEADRAGLLLSFLVAFGAAVGPGPNAIADGTKHPARLNAVLVGRSSRSRKGTSWAVVRRVFDEADPGFWRGRVIGSLASGEGLVAELSKRNEGLQRSVLVQEPELARLLRVAARSATLSALIRESWDSTDLAIITRKEPLNVSGVNVCVLAHITDAELRRRLDGVEAANGFGNRFLFCRVERSKWLPSGGNIPLDGLEVLGVKVRHAITRARQLGVLHRSPDAEAAWSDIYLGIDDDVDGVVGSLTARAEAQMLRLSVVYALLDGSSVIEVAHVQAAKAVWDHCEETVASVFAATRPDHVVARLLAALQVAGPAGLDGTQQRDLFSRNLAGSRLAAARWDLERRGLARTFFEETGGRPRVVTRACQGVTGRASVVSSSASSWHSSSVEAPQIAPILNAEPHRGCQFPCDGVSDTETCPTRASPITLETFGTRRQER